MESVFRIPRLLFSDTPTFIIQIPYAYEKQEQNASYQRSRSLCICIRRRAAARVRHGRRKLLRVNISSLSRVEFKEGGLNVVGQEERFLPYSGFGRVTIDHAGTHTPTSVRQVAETLSAFRIMTDRAGGTISLSGFGDGPTDVMIFSTAGNSVLSISGYSGGDIAVAGLPAGIYIVKTSAGNCAKFIK